MKTRLIANTLAGLAFASFTLAPLSALGVQGHGHGRGHDEHHGWNPAPPKKNGRHDNRDWNKKRSDWDHDYDRNRESTWDRTRTYSAAPYVSQYDRRQQTKNEWRNLAIGAGVIGVIGLLTKEPTLTFAGAAGALYSAYRYEQDRKSQNSLARARAYYFSRPYFYRNGTRYDRRTVVKSGNRYYQFVRHH